ATDRVALAPLAAAAPAGALPQGREGRLLRPRRRARAAPRGHRLRPRGRACPVTSDGPRLPADDVEGAPLEPVRYRVTGMDCADDAAEIEQAARAVSGVETVRVSTATQVMTVRISALGALTEAERAVAAIGYQLDRLDGPAPVRGTDPAG